MYELEVEVASHAVGAHNLHDYPLTQRDDLARRRAGKGKATLIELPPLVAAQRAHTHQAFSRGLVHAHESAHLVDPGNGCRHALAHTLSVVLGDSHLLRVARGSIGDALYRAKITLSTGELFAWTFVIILLSAGFEKLFLLALDKAVGAVLGEEETKC